MAVFLLFVIEKIHDKNVPFFKSADWPFSDEAGMVQCPNQRTSLQLHKSIAHLQTKTYTLSFDESVDKSMSQVV